MSKYDELKINYDNLKIIPASEIQRGSDSPLDDTLGLFRLCTKMQTICEKFNGVGLSAVQIGLPINVCIVKTSSKYEHLVNCTYVGNGEKIKSIEGCLSILDKDNNPRQFELKRFPEIFVSGYFLQSSENTPYVELKEIKNQLYSGFTAIIVQHELDHAAGVLISDIGQEIKVW